MRSIFDEKGVKIFILKNCWNRFMVRNLLLAKPAKRLVKPFWKISQLLDWKFYS